ncbi:MAG: hypothetical protein WC365_08610 [Candidatus Babeliales bacterium]|jgi:hypothetical protein
MSVIDISKLRQKDAEIKTPAIAVYVEQPCPKCLLGRMEFTGRGAQPAPNKPPIFEHVCSKCHHKEAYIKQYPTVEFVKIEKEEGEGVKQ